MLYAIKPVRCENIGVFIPLDIKFCVKYLILYKRQYMLFFSLKFTWRLMHIILVSVIAECNTHIHTLFLKTVVMRTVPAAYTICNY